MNNFIFTMFYLGIGLAAFDRYSERLSDNERGAMRWAFVGAAISAPLMILVTTYVLRGGDMLWYFRAANELVDLWVSNPGRWTPEIVKLSTRLTAQFPFWVHGSTGGSSTGAMFGVSTWVMLVCGKSPYAACMLISLLNFAARAAFYHAVRPYFEERHRTILIFACVGVPSQVFWTAGLLKEAVALAGMGWGFLGIAWVAREKRVLRGAVLIFIGVIPAYLVKPYLLFPFVIALGVWLSTERLVARSDDGRLRVNPLYLVAGIMVTILAVTILGTMFPQYAIGQLGDEFENIQTAGTNVSGDTNYQIFSPGEFEERPGLMRQVLFAPLGLLFALVRPVFFEVRNLQMLINSLETTAFTYLIIRMFFVHGAARVWGTIMRNPFILVCIAYVGIFGAAVGLASTNVGSLSRYRVPMMGLYAVIIFGIPALILQRSGAGASADETVDEQEDQPATRARGRIRPRSALSAAGREAMRARRVGGSRRSARSAGMRRAARS